MKRPLTIILLCGTLSACASGPRLQNSDRLTVIEASSLPSPDRTDLVAPDRASLIGPLDTLSVEVFNVPELSRNDVQVDASGRITLPLIGVIDVSGKTSNELAGDIKAKLAGRYVRNPDVTVNLKSGVSQVVTVDGEVKEPGLYPVTNQMTLLRAIASAKGTTEFAKLDEVVILRTVSGKKLAGLYSLSSIRRGIYDDPYVYANDVVVVGDSPTSRLLKAVLTIAPFAIAPVITLIR